PPTPPTLRSPPFPTRRSSDLALKTARRITEIKTFVPSGGRNAPKSTDKEIGRSAIRIADRDEAIGPINPETSGFAKTDLTKVERSEEHTSELQSQSNLVCRLL